MNYIIYGANDYLIKEAIDNIIKKYQMQKDDINHYNFNETSIKLILEDASLLPLFSDKKMIIVDQTNIFSSTGNKEDIEVLEAYLNMTNPNTILVFLVRGEKLDDRKKIVKLFKQNHQVIECNQTNINKMVNDMFQDYDISQTAISKFMSRVGNDLYKLKSESEKLKIFKINDKKITEDDILFTVKTVDDNVFSLIDAIVSRNIETSFELYQEIIKKNTEPIAILIMLANQIRLLYQSKTLYNQGKSEKEIAEVLEVHPYRVKLALEKSRNYASTMLIDYLEELADLDYEIKTGSKEASTGLELFLLGL